ncbi:MAG TPA: capsule assembly Wzi family protein [Acidobacteriota bacterium]|nr:capsule assembly Wzi family protein [Acidobacteriota bacterium]
MTASLMKKILPALLLFALGAQLSLAGVLPTGTSEYEFVYDRLERIDALTLDKYHYQLGPYRLDHQSFAFGPFQRLGEIEPARLELFTFAGEKFRAARRHHPQSFESLRGGIAGRPVRGVFVFGSFVLDEALARDEDYSGVKWRGLAGDVRQAFAHVRTGKLEMMVGRFASFWGIRNSLIFSRERWLDGLAYTFSWGRLALSYRLARLDGLSPDEDGVEQFENRYFAAHRLDIHLSRRLSVGLFETVLFGGPGRQIDLFYLNPLIFFHGSQLNDGANDNTTVGVDFRLKPGHGLKLYGQLLIDDLQVDSDTPSDKEPAEYGLVVGAYAADITRGLDVKMEYTRVTNWTFNQLLERNRYLVGRRLIGSALGNDYDLASVAVMRWFGAGTAAVVRLSYHRQGEGGVEDEWTEPWTLAEGDYSEPFPTGVVQSTTSTSLGIKSFLLDLAFVDLEIGVDWTKNVQHLQGALRTIPFVNVTISSFLFTSLNLE